MTSRSSVLTRHSCVITRWLITRLLLASRQCHLISRRPLRIKLHLGVPFSRKRRASTQTTWTTLRSPPMLMLYLLKGKFERQRWHRHECENIVNPCMLFVCMCRVGEDGRPIVQGIQLYLSNVFSMCGRSTTTSHHYIQAALDVCSSDDTTNDFFSVRSQPATVAPLSYSTRFLGFVEQSLFGS